MSKLQDPLPVKPVAALFSAHRDLLTQAARKLEKKIGPMDFISPEFIFDQSEYYREEMGWPLIKRFFACRELMDPVELVTLKVFTAHLEKEFSDSSSRRQVNIDPGYISTERLVLATGKNNVQRIYLGRGVWGDLTLIFERGEFKPLPWTYADYASPEVRLIMAEIRKKYQEQLRTQSKEE
ncbi:MAG: DUF4416 family protein [Deltaproteobacteria bacterium]|nr:DUF4416 family protein [Deltaproteobacteria bacterium]